MTADGRSLSAELAGLEDVKRRVARWRDSDQGATAVRITAGFWTARAIAWGLSNTVRRVWLPHFVAAHAALDLARREADIGIRNTPPDHPWLARRQLHSVTYAMYGLPNTSGFVATPPDVPSQRWLHTHHAQDIAIIANDPRLCLDLAESGHGWIVMPCFIGDRLKTVERQSDTINELTHDSWLVAHQDARHDPPIRAALTEIGEVLGEVD